MSVSCYHHTYSLSERPAKPPTEVCANACAAFAGLSGLSPTSWSYASNPSAHYQGTASSPRRRRILLSPPWSKRSHHLPTGNRAHQPQTLRRRPRRQGHPHPPQVEPAQRVHRQARRGRLVHELANRWLHRVPGRPAGENRHGFN